MSEKKWTPGPWELMNGGDVFGPLGGDSGDGVHCDSQDGWQVAEVGYYASFVDGALVELGEGCREANIALIAAAPELYEALEAALKRLQEYAEEDEVSTGYGSGCMSDPQEFIEDVMASGLRVMAKARGEQQ